MGWIILCVLVVLFFGMWSFMISMPGKSSPFESRSEKPLKKFLSESVIQLAGSIGERNYVNYANLTKAATYIDSTLAKFGYTVNEQIFTIDNNPYKNLEVELKGGANAKEIVIIGAHYDSVVGAPGANDNGSGVAALLALAKAFASKQPQRTLRFVAFVNEEPPHFKTSKMGSLVYAKRAAKRGEKIVAMLSLETIGYYRDEKGTQKYPFPLNFIYPSQGNFIGFVSNLGSRRLLHKVIRSFRRHTRFPSEGAALFPWIPGVGWSDQWAFWKYNYPAIMVTDTALFRYPYYHTLEDTPDKIDYDRLATVTKGLERVVDELVGEN